MERRRFLKIAIGCAAGASALAATAQGAPLLSQPRIDNNARENADPAVTTAEEVERLQPQEVRWGWHRHRHWGWHRRHWGWRRWHRRHWRHW